MSRSGFGYGEVVVLVEAVGGDCVRIRGGCARYGGEGSGLYEVGGREGLVLMFH